jgi:hypothetical protein
VIAATNEDKSIRVFENVFKQDGTHQLRSLSQRSVRMMGITQNDEGNLNLILSQNYAKTPLCPSTYRRRRNHNRRGQIWGRLLSPIVVFRIGESDRSQWLQPVFSS